MYLPRISQVFKSEVDQKAAAARHYCLVPGAKAPIIVAMTNTDPAAASAALIRDVVAETLAHGEAACRPVFFPHGLSRSLVSPAVDFVTALGGEVWFNRRLRGVHKFNDIVATLEFGQDG